MKQLSRKLAAFFLTLAILLSISCTAFAHEDYAEPEIEGNALPVTGNEVSPHANCVTHTWSRRSTALFHQGITVSSTNCHSYWEDYNVCTKCGEKDHIGYRYIRNDAHYARVYQATCNGRTQTWKNDCYYCGYLMANSTKTCPGGPHTGNCLWLPI